jgi:leader peptidase (prepilin peptidase)/N-methyltransferase
MIVSNTCFAAVAAGAIPAGYAAAVAARRLAESPHPSVWTMIAGAAALGAWATVIMPSLPLLAVTLGLGWALLVLAAVDALAFRLPDLLTLPLIVTGLGVSLILPARDIVGHIAAALIAMLLFYAVAATYRRLRGEEGLGLGGVKLAGAAGAWLGWEPLPYVVLFACAVGLVWVGVATIRRGREGLRERIPFGTALCIGIWLVWLYGPPEFFAPMI